MRLEVHPQGLAIIPESPADGYQVGRAEALMAGDLCIQRDPNDSVMVVNTLMFAAVDEALPWQGSGLGRVGFIKELLEIKGKYLYPRPKS